MFTFGCRLHTGRWWHNCRCGNRRHRHDRCGRSDGCGVDGRGSNGVERRHVRPRLRRAAVRAQAVTRCRALPHHACVCCCRALGGSLAPLLREVEQPPAAYQAVYSHNLMPMHPGRDAGHSRVRRAQPLWRRRRQRSGSRWRQRRGRRRQRRKRRLILWRGGGGGLGRGQHGAVLGAAARVPPDLL